MVDQVRSRLQHHRRKLVSVGLVVTALAVSGATLALDPIAGGATSRRADDAPRAAHIPIDAALVMRAHVEAEMKLRSDMPAHAARAKRRGPQPL